MKLSAVKAEEVSFDTPLELGKFEKFTSDLKQLAMKTKDPDVQASICRKLIDKVEVSTTGITIHYHVGDHHFEKEFGRAWTDSRGLASKIESSSRGLVERSTRPLFISRPLEKHRRSGNAAPGSGFLFSVVRTL